MELKLNEIALNRSEVKTSKQTKEFSLGYLWFLLLGFIVTMVGHLAKPFWGPEDDWCDSCREERLSTERNLKNCRIIGPIFLGIGALLTPLLLINSILYCRAEKEDNASEVLAGPTSDLVGSKTPGGSGSGKASAQYPPTIYGYRQPYGQTTPAYPPGPYPNPPPPYTTGPVYPPPTQFPDTSPQNGQEYLPYPSKMPPPPSYESTVGLHTSSSSTPLLEN